MKMISKSDIMEALGLEREDRFVTGLLVGVGVGAIVGGAVAMLLAPKSGSDLRGTIRSKGKEIVDRARGRMESTTSSPSV
jgi:gas vesicle protein